MKPYVTVGLTVLAGAALFEAALIPGVVIGGAAILAPRYLPGLRRRLKPLFGGAAQRPSQSARRTAPAGASPQRPNVDLGAIAARFGIGQAIAKTITYRIIVTALDFTTNYVVIGELTTAAGLSTFNLVVGPIFYLAHEAAWNYLGPPEATADVSVSLPLRTEATGRLAGQGGFTVSRALAKTVTFRTLATAMDFSVNYVATGDVATAVALSAFAFVVGPFVYLGHEKAWERFGAPAEPSAYATSPIKLVPAPTAPLPL
jgi:uncharacterized membrane protein